MAARETAPYPAASLSPIASPRRAGPTRSIFMITVVDQHKPWLMPSSTFAKTTQPQDGAKKISQRFHYAEAHDEGEHRRRRSQTECALTEQRHDTALESHHAANERIDDH